MQLHIKNTQAVIITIKETKLNQSHRISNIPQFTPTRTDHTHKQRGGFLTCIKNNISFSQLNTSNTLNITVITYCKHVHSIHLLQTEEDSITSSMLTTITNLPKHNHHSRCQCSLPLYLPTEDHRRKLMKDILLNSNHITLNTNTPTHLPPN